MNDLKVVFFDVDGTLARHNSGDNSSILERIPNSTIEAIEQLHQTDVLPVIATGRNRGMIQDVLERLQIDNLIANNGRFVEINGKVVKHDTFTDQQLRLITQSFNEQEIPFCFETADHLYKNRHSGFEPDSSMDLREIDDDEIPDQVIQLIVRNDQEKPLSMQVPGVKLVKVAKTVYDVTQDFSNKAVGIQAFMKESFTDKSKTMAFGDEENDLEMFDQVHFAIAMGNAAEIVKKRADFVTTSIEDDGIYRGLHHFNLI